MMKNPMGRYALQRLAAIGALAFGITLLVFLIIRLIPGDPAIVMLGTNAGDHQLIARLHQQLGLDRSIPEQYVVWLGRVLHGDFGYSYGQQQSVASLIGQNMPGTIELTAASLSLSLLLGAAVGVTAAARRNRLADTAGMGIALAFMSIPSFWLGLLLILLPADHVEPRQLDGEHGCQRIYEEYISGGRWDRPELHSLLDRLEPADVLTVWKLDRLSRSLKDPLLISDKVERAGAGFRSVAEDIDSTAASGRPDA